MRLLLFFCAFGLITSLHAGDDDLYTNVYVVPPTFLAIGSADNNLNSASDLFRDLRPMPKRKTAKEILEGAGITFGKGRSAIYNPGTSQLIVRNTQEQMELVEAYIDSIITLVEKQLYVSTTELAISGGLSDLDTEGIEAPVTEFLSVIAKAIEAKRATRKEVALPVTRFKSFEAFRDNLATNPAELAEVREQKKTTIQLSAAPISKAMFQLIIKQLAGSKKVTQYKAPTAMSRSGEPFVTEVRKRRYGIDAVLGADEFTADIHAFIPEPDKALQHTSGQFTTPFSKTVFDTDHAVFVSRSDERNETRLIFVRAQIVDPAGQPIHKNGGRAAKEAAGKQETKEPKNKPQSTSPEQAMAIKEADNLAATGVWYLSNDLFNESTIYFSEALKVLPRLEMTEKRREAYEKQLAKAQEFATDEPKKVSLLRERMELVVLPEIDFRDKPPMECFAAFLALLLEQKQVGLFPEVTPKLVFENPDKFSNQGINTGMDNPSALSALERLCDATHSRYELDGETIRIIVHDK